MTVLPIAQRELRVAARKRSTFWVRIVAAVLALSVTGLILPMFSFSRGFMTNRGQILFSALAWLAFIYAFAAGVFLTSDCLSEEKREGTMGLLFLTDLRGYDVVLGKLAATSLHAFYGLIAAFPIIAISLLLGGLLAEQFWKSMLAIANMLFYSLAVGILASCLSREALRAINAALLLLALLMGVPFLLDFALAGWDPTKFVPRASLTTPLYAFLKALAPGRSHYWLSISLSHAVGWLLLAITAWAAPRSWQERRFEQNRRLAQLQARRTLKEAHLRSGNPILWLAGRARRFRLWMFVGVLAVTVAAAFTTDSRTTIQVAQALLNLFGILFYVWMAAHASRFFADGVKSGSLELILCTPVTGRDIVNAQWYSFLRTFTFPLLFLITTEQLVAFTLLMDVFAANPISGYLIANQISSVITSITSAAAIGWFAMWSGLRSRKAHVAVIKTLVFVFVLPFIVTGVLQVTFALGFMFRSGNFDWVGPIITCALWVAKDAAFILWSRHRLYTRFHEAVSGIQSGGGPPPQLPDALPPVIPDFKAPPAPLLRE